MSYSDADLQAAWNRFVGMNNNDVIYLTNSASSGYDSAFAAILEYIYQNRLFGFANYNYSASGSNQFPGGRSFFNGPTKS